MLLACDALCDSHHSRIEEQIRLAKIGGGEVARRVDVDCSACFTRIRVVFRERWALWAGA